jgi:hypothetical protein
VNGSLSVSEKLASVREQRREAQRSISKATHALVQYGSGTGPGNHVPCEVLGEEKDGRLRVQVVGCEPFDTKAWPAGKRVVRTREGEKWQWVPGTVHKRDDCEECRTRRGR